MKYILQTLGLCGDLGNIFLIQFNNVNMSAIEHCVIICIYSEIKLIEGSYFLMTV